jgi:RimJ/RimL family protein N-acetyltransferase
MIRAEWNLTNENIQIRNFYPCDVTSHHVDVLNNRNHMKYSRQRLKTHTLSTARIYFDELQSNGGIALGIFDLNQHFCKGTVTILPVGESVSFGFLVYPEFANSGVLSGSLPLILSKLSEDESLDWMHIGTHIDNIPMRRVAMKHGFKPVGIELIEKFNSTPPRNINEIHFLRSCS